MSSMLKILDADRVFIGTLLVPDGVKQGMKLRGYYQMAVYDKTQFPFTPDFMFGPHAQIVVQHVLFRDARDPTGRLCATVEGMTIAELEREDGFAFIPKSAAGGR